MRASGIAGKTAFVTGAGGGIGAALVRALHAEGARIVATDLAAAGIADLARELGPQVRAEPLDVRRSEDVDALVARVERDWGRSTWASTSPACCATGRWSTPPTRTGRGCSTSTPPACSVSRGHWRGG